jgi:peptide/nickel transport system permease protein
MTLLQTRIPAGAVDGEGAAASGLAALRRWREGDLPHAFLYSKTALPAAIFLLTVVVAVAGAPWIAPHTPYDLATLDLLDAQLPPAWLAGGKAAYLLGTDEQGRDVLSAIIYGARTSLMVACLSVLMAASFGTILGLLSGFLGGVIDGVTMRVADIQMTIPDIMLALLATGILHASLPRELQSHAALFILVLAIGFSSWPQYARVIRASTMAERHKDYVAAARVTGAHPVRIVFAHILPNITGPICILATQGFASAILAESALSFIGVGMPVTEPSLGTMIRVGNSYLFAGEWWTCIFPSVALCAIVLSINLLGDWLKDTLNPKLG